MKIETDHYLAPPADGLDPEDLAAADRWIADLPPGGIRVAYAALGRLVRENARLRRRFHTRLRVDRWTVRTMRRLAVVIRREIEETDRLPWPTRAWRTVSPRWRAIERRRLEYTIATLRELSAAMANNPLLRASRARGGRP